MSLSSHPEKVKEKNYQTVKTTADLARVLATARECRIALDCGHHCTVGHNFANTMIIYSLGGGRIGTSCHSCGY